jgi:hypothetical protein
MSKHIIFLGWNRSIPGREELSNEHLQEFMQYAVGLQQSGTIDSFEVVFLGFHGGDLNGFALVRGDRAKLDELERTEEWMTHVTRSGYHLDGFGVIRGVTGEGVLEQVQLWNQVIGL